MVSFSRMFLILYLILLVPTVSGAELELAIADSTCSVLKKVGKSFTQKHNIPLRFTCKSSGLLAKGLETGVIQADFFLSANKKWMESMVAAGLVSKQSVQTLWANKLIVVEPVGRTSRINSLNDLTSPDFTRIIIGDPSHAPFGRYAKTALQKAGIWSEIRNKIISRKYISLAIKSIQEGTPGTAGIIYRSGLDPTLRPLFTISSDLSGPIHYFSAPLITSESKKEMVSFLAFLESVESRKLFEEAGFVTVDSNSPVSTSLP